jgi:hypothetical protein
VFCKTSESWHVFHHERRESDWNGVTQDSAANAANAARKRRKRSKMLLHYLRVIICFIFFAPFDCESSCGIVLQQLLFLSGTLTQNTFNIQNWLLKPFSNNGFYDSLPFHIPYILSARYPWYSMCVCLRAGNQPQQQDFPLCHPTLGTFLGIDHLPFLCFTRTVCNSQLVSASSLKPQMNVYPMPPSSSSLGTPRDSTQFYWQCQSEQGH